MHIGQWVSETFSELILFSTTIGASCHTIMKQVNATLSNYLEREILCIEILWLTVVDLGNSFWHSPKIFILFLQLGIEGVTLVVVAAIKLLFFICTCSQTGLRASFSVLRRKSWELSHVIYLKLTNSYNSVFFSKVEWWIAELLFLSLNNWGLNFLQNESSQFV